MRGIVNYQAKDSTSTFLLYRQESGQSLRSGNHMGNGASLET